MTQGLRRPSDLYEKLVARLLKTRLKKESGETPQIWHAKRYKGASGQTYEIDVSFVATVAGSRVLVAVECKHYKSRVGLDEIAELAYKVNDIGAHKGICVTTVGFQSGAIAIAKREGIALVRAVRSLHYVSYHDLNFARRAPYVIYDDSGSEEDLVGRRFRYPTGTHYESPPLRTHQTYLLTEESTNALEIDQIAFEPGIEGFDGDACNLLSAAVIFCIESDQDEKVLSEIRLPVDDWIGSE